MPTDAATMPTAIAFVLGVAAGVFPLALMIAVVVRDYLRQRRDDPANASTAARQYVRSIALRRTGNGMRAL